MLGALCLWGQEQAPLVGQFSTEGHLCLWLLLWPLVAFHFFGVACAVLYAGLYVWGFLNNSASELAFLRGKDFLLNYRDLVWWACDLSFATVKRILKAQKRANPTENGRILLPSLSRRDGQCLAWLKFCLVGSLFVVFCFKKKKVYKFSYDAMQLHFPL